MKTFKPLALGLMTRPIEFQRRFFLTVAAISFCPMGDTPALLGEVAMWKFVGEALPPGTALDMVMPKTAAEFLVTGSAFAPGGAPVQTVNVAARLGAVTKRLAAVGDRYIENGVPTHPAPFTEMPLGWHRAYGGPKYAENPLGRGIEEMPIPGVGFRVALPNVVLPQGAERPRSPEPVGFGPLDISWPQRQRLAGTYDQRWLDEDFPGMARDTDWRILMAAPADQRFAGYLRGDEDYAFTNMHAAEQEVTGRLPGIQPRILIERRGGSRVEDVPLALTTVWFFPAHKRLVMIHHGRVRVQEEDARDVTRLVLGADMLGDLRPSTAFDKVIADRLDPEYGVLEAMRDSALVPADLIVPDPDMEVERELNEFRGIQQERGYAREVKQYEETRARLVAAEVEDHEKYLPPLPTPPEKPPRLEDIPAVVDRVRRQTEELEKEAKASLAKADEDAKAAAAEAKLPYVPGNAPPAGPPSFRAAAARAELEGQAAQVESAGGDATPLRGLLADPAHQGRMVELEESQRAGYRQMADGQSPAPRLDAAANEALRARLFDGRRGGQRLDLCGADLAGLDLSGFDLTEAWLDGADLTGANLSRAKLDRAVLAHARLEGANLAGAELIEANLGRARLAGADLSQTRLRGAVLRGADLRGTRLAGSDLTDAILGEGSFEEADFSGVIASGLMLVNVEMPRLKAVGARFDKALFMKADLRGADFSGALLASATFVSASAEGIVFDGAEMPNAVFVESCDLRGARFAQAQATMVNLRGSNLEAAVLDGAVMDKADLSDCRLVGASLDLLRAREARFVCADLQGARITRADLAGAMLSRADLRGADLSDSSLYEADLARIHGDAATRYERIHRTRVRLNPRRSPT